MTLLVSIMLITLAWSLIELVIVRGEGDDKGLLRYSDYRVADDSDVRAVDDEDWLLERDDPGGYADADLIFITAGDSYSPGMRKNGATPRMPDPSDS